MTVYKIPPENPPDDAQPGRILARANFVQGSHSVSADKRRTGERMAIVLVILAAVFVGVLGVHGYKQFKIRQQRQMNENEYNAAVTVWKFARVVKEHIDGAIRQGTGVLDFTRITVPHTQGYEISLEMIGAYFRVYAVPARYNRTGKLSFLTDNTLSVRASDRMGQQATSEDGEYKGDAEL
jgi:hypothetical protein